jgi:hypothetical protein
MNINGYLIDATKKALKIVVNGRPKGTWIPKSQVIGPYNLEPHYYQNFDVRTWILKKKRLLPK